MSEEPEKKVKKEKKEKKEKKVSERKLRMEKVYSEGYLKLYLH